MSEPSTDPTSRGPRADQPALNPPTLNPAALPVADAARVLSRMSGSGRPITEAMLRADIGAGAPVNADGSLNLIHYAAWLVKQLAAGARAEPATSPTLDAVLDCPRSDDARGATPITLPPGGEPGGED